MEHKITERDSKVPNKRGGNGEMSSNRYKTKDKAQNKSKSKLKHLVETSYDNTLNMRKQQPYLNTNNRGECSAIFSTRTLMLKVKENYSSKNVDKSCRFCKTQESETQTHILEKCKELETETKYIDQHHLKKATEHITKIEAKQILQIKTKSTSWTGQKPEKR